MQDSLRQNLQRHLVEIVRDRDPFLATAGHFYVQRYIQQQLSQWGEVIPHEFSFNGRTHQNLILNLPAAQTTGKPPILIGAHYDTVPGSPGADDNATGVAVLLELARVFAQQPARHPIRCVAFDLEEMGVGNAAYVAELRQKQEPLRLMLSLEMLGYCDRTPHSQHYPLDFFKLLYPNQGNYIALIGTPSIIPDLWRLSRTMRQSVPCEWLAVPNRGKLLPDSRRSDHAPFWDAGYRALMVTDTANLRNPHYHRQSDRLETLDLEFLTQVCYGLIEALHLL
ncbi:MAG: M20/M25/M40 family metallo-hydrolase [Oculatellaceae cyanobacterium Prado106]|jgi:Zn-dependent M28 family amino/carboxypeptidase|nr:M20/M25/M40 family metallo-hydrolase [Oculatellaceae cyanobacterium Prado106]